MRSSWTLHFYGQTWLRENRRLLFSSPLSGIQPVGGLLVMASIGQFVEGRLY